MLVHHRRNERDIKHIRSGLLFTMARACHQSGEGVVFASTFHQLLVFFFLFIPRKRNFGQRFISHSAHVTSSPPAVAGLTAAPKIEKKKT